MLLYHSILSAPSRLVRLVMGEYGLEADLHEEHVWERRAEFLSLNPAGTVPVLCKDGATIVGAMPVTEYLDETQGALRRDGRLFPDTPLHRAEMRRICEWALVKLEADVTSYLVTERVTKRQRPAESGGGAPDSQALRAARSNIRYHIRYLSWLVEDRDWMAGRRMSQADLAVAAAISVLDYMGEVDWEDADAASLREWYARIKSRPAFRPLLADRVRGLPPVSHYVDLDF